MTRIQVIVAKSKRAKNRRGATVLEYAFVGLLVLILLSMISMGVLRTRETARDNMCRRRLVLLSRAVTDYVDIHIDYPGYANSPENAQTPSLSWVATTLPFLQDRLPTLISTSEGWKVQEESEIDGTVKPKHPWPDWRKALNSTVPFLICPSEDPDRIKPGVSSYVASCGYADAPDDDKPADYSANGIFLDLRRSPGLSEKALQNLDGTEFTILLSENIQSGSWDSSRESEVGLVWSENLAIPTQKGNSAEPEVFGLNKNFREAPNGYKTARPSSHHAGGVHVSFANTRIMKVGNNIDPVVYIRLCAADDANLKNPWTQKRIGPPIGIERIEQTPSAAEPSGEK